MHRIIIPFLAALLAMSGFMVLIASGGTPPPTPSVEIGVVVDGETGQTLRSPVEASRVPVPAEAKYRLPAEARVRFVEAAAVPTLCGLPTHPVIACVNDIGGDTITLPNPCDPEFIGEDYAAVVCHEKGHIHGWLHEMPHFYPTPEVTLERNNDASLD